jgi:hypothetical protein
MRSVQIAGLAAMLLASGCCLPRLSGRYCDQPQTASALPQPDRQQSTVPGREANVPDGSRLHGGRSYLAGLHERYGHAGGIATPPGELIPLPRFHPVPVHPVFEPQLDYLLPQPIEIQPAPISPAPADGIPTPAKPLASAT